MDLRPIPVSGDDELARLTQSFNTMLRAVANLKTANRLVADAGHELRTGDVATRNWSCSWPPVRKAPDAVERDRADIEPTSVRNWTVTQLIDDLSSCPGRTRRDTAERVDLVDVVDALSRGPDGSGQHRVRHRTPPVGAGR